MGNVKLGIENIDRYSEIFRGKRVGLITNPTGVDRSLRSSIDILKENTNLTALYSPEHGIRGDIQAGERVSNYIDESTGIVVYSLYGENKKPPYEFLENIDLLAIDIQDVGSRFYTYLYTMVYAMESCKELNKTFVVFDRPNPIGGEIVEGNLLDTKYKSFVGLYPIPQRYGLTIGEAALLFNSEFNINCDLKVIKMEGWQRSMYFEDTELPWVLPSPNMPTIDTAILYNGTCIFEGTNISEGRGTTKPFEFIGAPWLNPIKLAEEMNALNLPGVRFRPVYFTPSFSKHSGKLCKGVQIHILNKRSVKAVELGLILLHKIMEMDKLNFSWLPPFKDGAQYFIDHIAGSKDLRDEKMELDHIIMKWRMESSIFKNLKHKYHMY